MSEIRKKYDKDFKRDAVELLRKSGKSCNQIAKDLGIGETVLRRWNIQYDNPNSFPGNGNPIDKEMYKLKKELDLIKEERDILKKSYSHLLKIKIGKFAFMKLNADKYSIKKMAEIFKVSRSGYYAYINRPESKRSKNDKIIIESIKSIYEES